MIILQSNFVVLQDAQSYCSRKTNHKSCLFGSIKLVNYQILARSGSARNLSLLTSFSFIFPSFFLKRWAHKSRIKCYIEQFI